MIEASYIPLARRIVTAAQLEAKAKEDKLTAKRSCATAMHKFNVKSFVFQAQDRTYKARLARPVAKRVCVRKLYNLVKIQELSLDDFFECVTASAECVSDMIGEERTNKITEEYQRSLDLLIKQISSQ